jgi:hypothetical protein
MTQPTPRLGSVHTTAVHGNVERVAPIKSIQMSLIADWDFQVGALSFRFTASCDFFDIEVPAETSLSESTESKLGTAGGRIVVQYVAPPDMPEPPDETWYQDFITNRALADAIPYIRELVGSTAGRMGFPNVTIDSIPMDEFRANQDVEPPVVEAE